jgi:predicted kinase
MGLEPKCLLHYIYMSKLIVGIGLPGAGKTEVLRSFAEKNGYEYLSTENVRAALGIGDGVASPAPVWEEIRRYTKECIDADKILVLESTFVTGPDRRMFLEFARAAGAEKIQGVFIDTPSEIAWERNEARERTVPEGIFKSRAADLKKEPPGVEDGFDSLFTLNQNQELVSAEVRRPEFIRERRFL